MAPTVNPDLYNTLTNETLASEDYSRWILGPPVLGTTTQHRDAYVLLAPSTINALQPLSAALTGIPVQIFLVKRAITLPTSRWAKRVLSAFFSILIFLETFAMLLNVILNLLFHYKKLSQALVALVTYSYCSGRIAGFNARTDQALRALVWLAVQSGSYTAILASTGALIAYSAPRDLRYTSLAFAFWYPLPSCYALTILTALSSRLILHKPDSFTDTGEELLSPMPIAGVVAVRGLTHHPGRQNRQKHAVAAANGGGIQVAQEVSVHVEMGKRDSVVDTADGELKTEGEGAGWQLEERRTTRSTTTAGDLSDWRPTWGSPEGEEQV
ncbi:hypothetical protein JCM10213_008297 [Rhodosporidiobolus nylandii]